MRKFLLSFLAVAGVVLSGFAQNRTVQGTVADQSGSPIIGAAVVVTGTSRGVTTDSYGHFSLSVPADATLDVSFLGFVPQQVAVNNRTNLDITLHEDTQALEEVIVVAFGQTTKEAFTGSVGVVKSEELEKRQVSNVSQALSGAVAGVQVLTPNGQPGETATVRIRGIGSINAGTAPLYVVDGVPFDGDLSSINTQDIESMTVLKDAASAALYGARGANGVILINTKRGAAGRVSVSFEGRWGVNSVATPNYDVLTDPGVFTEKAFESYYNARLAAGDSAAAAHRYANTMLTDMGDGGLGYKIFTVPDGQYLVGTNGKINPNAKLGYSDGTYYYTPDNWRKESMRSNLRQEYNVNVSGGSERVNFYASLGFLDDKGIIDNSAFTRYSMRLKGDFEATKWLKIGGNMSFAHSISAYPDDQTTTNSSNNVFAFANFIAPIYPMYVRNADGSKVYDERGNIVYDFGNGDSNNKGGMRTGFHPGSNPVAELYYNESDYRMDIFGANWFATVTPVKGLSLTARFGLDVDNTRYTQGNNVYYGQFAQDYGGTVYKENDRTYGFNQQYIANYQHTFCTSHHIDVMAGFESYDYRESYLYGSSSMLYNPNIYELGNTIGSQSTGSASDYYATMGIVARANYDYDSRIFVSGSYRRDASSRFHPSHRWGNFFSASAAWVLSNERFMSDVKWVDLLKLKASYGQQGNDSVGNFYAYMDQYKMTGSGTVFSDGVLVYKGNPDLTWETSHSFNAGVEFGFWHGRLSGSVEYFMRRSADMLYYKPVAPTAGYSQIPMNVGSMTNSGVEIDLLAGLIQHEKVAWDFNVNATFLGNKINSLHPDLGGELIDGSRIYTEGESMYRYYLPHYMGVDRETGAPLYYWEDEAGNPSTTSEWAKASQFRQASKNLLPKVYGGFGTSLTFYGVDFSIQFAYQLGGTTRDYGYELLMHTNYSDDAGYNWHKDILRSWTPENPDTDIPAVNADYEDGRVNGFSDRFLVSSDYLSINNITLGYTLPSSLMSKAGIKQLRIYVAADNVALVSARKGLDPRQSYTASTSAYYSPIRTISGGIKLTF